MLLDLLQLAAGLTILIFGGDLLVRAASSLARDLGVSTLVIGLTVVAFGTSAPELAVNIGAALRDAGSLAFGNVLGSNMANIGLIIGLVAVLQPIPIQNILIRRELPMLLLATTAALVMAFDSDLGGSRDAYMRTDGIVLLLFFFVFLYYTVGDLFARRFISPEAAAEMGPPLIEIPDIEGGLGKPRIWRDAGLTLLGLCSLIGGAELTIAGATGLAHLFEVPEVVIGLTMVAIGTSLPELAAAILSLRHGKPDMAVGTVVGSNIFNTLLVIGVTATIRPMPIPKDGHIDLLATAALSLMFVATAVTKGHRIIRTEGLLLMLAYVTYLASRTLSFIGS